MRKYVESSSGQRTPLGTYTNEPSVKTAAFSEAKKLSVKGTTDPRYFFTKLECFCTASEKEQKITPISCNFSLKVVATDTLSNTASTATPARRFRSSRGIPSFSYVRRISGSRSSRLSRTGFCRGAE